jgi:hypothetical protein
MEHLLGKMDSNLQEMKASQEWMKTKIEDNHQRLYTRMKAY